MDGQWRLKKRLLQPPRAPQRKQRLAVPTAKRAVLQLDDDPWMKRARASEGGTAPLTVYSPGEEKPTFTFQPITDGPGEVAAKEALGKEATEVAEEAKVVAEEVQAIDLLAHESPLSSPSTWSEEAEQASDHVLDGKTDPTLDADPDHALDDEDEVDHVEALGSPEDMGHDE